MYSFTQEDLIQLIYGETSQEKKSAIEQALATDWKLKEEYEALISAQKGLEKVSLAPRKKALDFIMNYAAKPEKEVFDFHS